MNKAMLETNNESKIRKILFNEISLAIAIIGATSGIIFWLFNPIKTLEIQVVRLEQQIESNKTVVATLQNIKDNDLNEIEMRLSRMEERQIEILKAIARLEVLYK